MNIAVVIYVFGFTFQLSEFNPAIHKFSKNKIFVVLRLVEVFYACF
jgi:hypothetical protein